jgi:DNA-binding GntR family transcriptional regulator
MTGQVNHVEQDLRRRLESAEWDHYAALPVSRELARHYKTSHVTIWKVLAKLKSEGLLYGLPGSIAGRRAYRRSGPSGDCSDECRARWH